MTYNKICFIINIAYAIKYAIVIKKTRFVQNLVFLLVLVIYNNQIKNN